MNSSSKRGICSRFLSAKRITAHPCENCPFTGSDFEHVVEQTVKQKLQSTLNEYYALTESLASVEAGYTGSDIEECEEFASVKCRLEEKQRVIHELLGTGALDWNTAFSVFDDGQPLESDAVTQAESVVLPNL